MVQLQMLQQQSAKAWQEVTLKCKNLSISDEMPPLFKSSVGDIRPDYTEVLSNSCKVTMVTYIFHESNKVTVNRRMKQARQNIS